MNWQFVTLKGKTFHSFFRQQGIQRRIKDTLKVFDYFKNKQTKVYEVMFFDI